MTWWRVQLWKFQKTTKNVLLKFSENPSFRRYLTFCVFPLLTILPYKNVNNFTYTEATKNPIAPFQIALDFLSGNPIFNLQAYLQSWTVPVKHSKISGIEIVNIFMHLLDLKKNTYITLWNKRNLTEVWKQNCLAENVTLFRVVEVVKSWDTLYIFIYFNNCQ